jgi:hypothetical protein
LITRAAAAGTTVAALVRDVIEQYILRSPKIAPRTKVRDAG